MIRSQVRCSHIQSLACEIYRSMVVSIQMDSIQTKRQLDRYRRSFRYNFSHFETNQKKKIWMFSTVFQSNEGGQYSSTIQTWFSWCSSLKVVSFGTDLLEKLSFSPELRRCFRFSKRSVKLFSSFKTSKRVLLVETTTDKH